MLGGSLLRSAVSAFLRWFRCKSIRGDEVDDHHQACRFGLHVGSDRPYTQVSPMATVKGHPCRTHSFSAVPHGTASSPRSRGDFCAHPRPEPSRPRFACDCKPSAGPRGTASNCECLCESLSSPACQSYLGASVPRGT